MPLPISRAFLLSTALSILIGGAAALSAAESVNLSASKTTGVAVNETVTVSLVLASGTPFNAFQGYLEWNKALLELSSSPTTALIDTNSEAFSAAPGFVLSTARAAGSGKRGFFTTAGDVSQPGATLMTWTFKALATGTAVVQTRQASVSDDFTKISNESGVTRYPAVGPAVSITIGSTPTNLAPIVNAGPDQTITLPSTASLAGTATDDGLPAPSALTRTWSRISGPGTVTFSPDNQAATTATFSAPGSYVLQLRADDGLLFTTDLVTVTVNPAGTPNTAPVVNAGVDQTITLPALATLSGTVTDDGLPAPSALTRTWSRISGPGTVIFSPDNQAATTATFSAPGSYVLQLRADDGLLSTSDLVTVTVNPDAGGAGGGGVPAVGGGSSGGSGGCGLGSGFAALLMPGLLLVRRNRQRR